MHLSEVRHLIGSLWLFNSPGMTPSTWPTNSSMLGSLNTIKTVGTRRCLSRTKTVFTFVILLWYDFDHLLFLFSSFNLCILDRARGGIPQTLQTQGDCFLFLRLASSGGCKTTHSHWIWYLWKDYPSRVIASGNIQLKSKDAWGEN